MFANRISQILHDEHRMTIALMERLERAISRRQPANVADQETLRLLRDLVVAMDGETWRHFDFEEGHLFTFLQSIGDQAICDLLTEEHAAMRPIGEELAALSRKAQASGFDAACWQQFQRVGAEIAERMLLHVQKEEMALLPLINDAMDAETEARLYEVYVENI